MAKSFEKNFIQIILRTAFALVLMLSFLQLKANPGNDSHSIVADSGMKHQHTTAVGEASMATIESHANSDHSEKAHAFDPGHMITEHISDAHDWHLWGHTHVALPVILYTDKGFEVFSSNNFRNHDGHGMKDYTGKYNTYRLEDEEVKVIVNGEIDASASSDLLDVSITKNTLTLFIVSVLMLLIFTSVARAYKKRPGQAPKGLQSFIEPIIIFVRDDIAKPNIGKKYEKFMPYLLTVFFFIWISNLLGLVPVLPGGANFTGNIAVTLTLALLTFIITTINGNKHYWGHIFAMPGVPAWVLIILTPIEILGMFLRPFVLMIRLFANISAGHIIALAFFSLIFIFGKGGESVGAGVGVGIASWLFTVFMMFLELLVAFLQAFVFALLSAVYFGSAVEEGHHEEHAEHAH